jgi:protein-S-isoprenylcysteine O-methyltransferase Ste14
MEEAKKPSVHVVLAKSYLTYFLLCSFGLFLETFFPLTIPVPQSVTLAVICFAVGPLLILWAQITSHRYHLVRKETDQIRFDFGPYRFLRNPTHLGLLILVGGYTLVTQAAMLFVVTGVAYIISNIFFRKYEILLENTHGDIYKTYKSSVRKIM